MGGYGSVLLFLAPRRGRHGSSHFLERARSPTPCFCARTPSPAALASAEVLSPFQGRGDPGWEGLGSALGGGPSFKPG